MEMVVFVEVTISREVWLISLTEIHDKALAVNLGRQMNLVVEFVVSIRLPRLWAVVFGQYVFNDEEVHNSYQRVPWTCAQAHAIVANTQTADTVAVANQCANLLPASNIPDLKIILAPIQLASAELPTLHSKSS